MLNRRSALKGGLGAVAGILLGRNGRAWGGQKDGSESSAAPLDPTRPIIQIPESPESMLVNGIRFGKWYLGDDFANNAIPFHACDACDADWEPPPATEEVDIAIVGGGISGLATAYLLRAYRPVLLEMRPRFGGNAQGEEWSLTPYSLGSAYVISPDRKTFLDQLYHELGLHRVVRVDDEDNGVELHGRILKGFWQGEGSPPEDAAGFERYAEIVRYYAERSYPDIPLPDGEVQWILDLDRKTLRQDIEERMRMPVPNLLAQAIQGYCYSSFGIGWDEISAASGWNFLAAEEFGRWVFPGGNAYMALAFWRELRKLEENPANPRYLRAGCRVFHVQLTPKDKVQVTYFDANGAMHSLLARRVVMCGSKHVAKYVLRDVQRLDPPKWEAMQHIETVAYLVANVLLERPIELDFYDIFLLGDGDLPLKLDVDDENRRFQVVDALNGAFARQVKVPRTVLTLYWPQPWHTARFPLISDPQVAYYRRCADQLERILGLFGLDKSVIRQVRLARWGHAMPVARPNLIADGVCDALRRPFEGKVWFINQDNWALPAVENCLLDAEIFVPQIARGL